MKINAAKAAIGAAFCLYMALAGCSTAHDDGGTDGRLYSYVDAQGQLVTIEKPASEQGTAAAPASQEQGGGEVDDGERYQSSEQVDQALEARDRERFVTFVDEQGNIQRQQYDRLEARDAMRDRPRPWQPVAEGVPDGFVETVRAVTADCCVAAAAQEASLEIGVERRVRFRGAQSVMVRLDGQQYPAAAYRLPADAARITFRTYARPGQPYLHPQALFLDAQAIPVMLVDNLFQRWFEPNWYRYGFLEGEIEIPEAARSLVLFLGYAPDGEPRAPAEGTVLALTRVKGSPMGLAGDVTLILSDEPTGNPRP